MLHSVAKTPASLILANVVLTACNSGGGENLGLGTGGSGNITSNVATLQGSFDPLTPNLYYLLPAGPNEPVVVGSAEGSRSSDALGAVTYSVKAYDTGDAEAIATRYLTPNTFGLDLSTRKEVLNLPDSGKATLSGTVEIVRAARSGPGDQGEAQYSITKQSGDLSLVADLAAETLTGSSNLIDIDGVIDGKNLTGSVSHEGISGELNGRIGNVRTTVGTQMRDINGNQIPPTVTTSIQALGAFAGSDSARGITYSGGFSVRD